MDYRSPAGYDRTRNTVIGHKDYDLTYLEESFTSEHWLVRVYRLAVWSTRGHWQAQTLTLSPHLRFVDSLELMDVAFGVDMDGSSLPVVSIASAMPIW